MIGEIALLASLLTLSLLALSLPSIPAWPQVSSAYLLTSTEWVASPSFVGNGSLSAGGCPDLVLEIVGIAIKKEKDHAERES